jgi:hypothetical protein
MASKKQQRKAAKKPKPANWVHPDGDRRHRDGMQKCINDMKARKAFEAQMYAGDKSGEEE